jgi:hypothetical protein
MATTDRNVRAAGSRAIPNKLSIPAHYIHHHPRALVEARFTNQLTHPMPGEMNRYRPPEAEAFHQEPEYIEFNEHERQIEAIGEALKLARSLQTKIRDGVSDPERQRAYLDLVAILDNQLQEERATLQDPKWQRQLRPADRQQFQRAFAYLDRATRTIDAEAE